MAITTIVYPYLESLSQGQELKYSIRSLCKFLDFDFDVVIVGDKPSWYNGKHIQTSAIRGVNFARAFDIAHKLELVFESDLISDNFVWCYDDIYAVNRCGWGYFGKIIALEPMMNKPVRMGSNKWNKMLESSFDALGLETAWNYETHLPRMFNKNMLKWICETYRLNKQPLLFSTLYFNEYFEKPEIVLSEKNEVKAGVYSKMSHDQIVELAKNKIWLNNGESGWNVSLERFLKNMYPEVCRYELK